MILTALFALYTGVVVMSMLNSVTKIFLIFTMPSCLVEPLTSRLEFKRVIVYSGVFPPPLPPSLPPLPPFPPVPPLPDEPPPPPQPIKEKLRKKANRRERERERECFKLK
jgi:hypothetical protein